MRCHELEQQLQETLDLRRPLALNAAQAAHVETCDTCRIQVQDFQQLRELLAPRKKHSGNALIAQQIVVAALQGQFSDHDEVELAQGKAAPAYQGYTPATKPRSSWYVALLSLSAVALVGATLSMIPRQAKDSTLLVANPGSPAVAQANVPTAPAPVEEKLVATKGAPLVQPADPDAAAMATAPQLQTTPIGWEYQMAISNWSKELPDAVSKLEEVQEFTPGLRPIKASFSTAIDTLLRTFPGSRDNHMMPRPDTGYAPLSQPVSA